MCGRYQLTKNTQLALRFGLVKDQRLKVWKPALNISPTQKVIAIVKATQNEAHLMRWGLIRSWSKDPTKFLVFNARMESILEDKPYFKGLLNRKRCLIPATGFYEWKTINGKKIPYLIKVKNEDLFAFAGVFDSYESPQGEVIESCSIVTMPPNKFMEKIHNRMPFILEKDIEQKWLEGEMTPKLFEEFSKQANAVKLDAELANPDIFKRTSKSKKAN